MNICALCCIWCVYMCIRYLSNACKHILLSPIKKRPPCRELNVNLRICNTQTFTLSLNKMKIIYMHTMSKSHHHHHHYHHDHNENFFRELSASFLLHIHSYSPNCVSKAPSCSHFIFNVKRGPSSCRRARIFSPLLPLPPTLPPLTLLLLPPLLPLLSLSFFFSLR